MQKLKRKGVERLPLPFLDQHYPCECGTYVAVFAEFLSDEMKVPSIPFRSDYLRSRYATLLWKYGTDKAKAGYVRKSDDPTRLKGAFIPLTDDELINVE
uniref:Ulp1 protease family, C-terminal catalytic domain containing protein n=1 Tax=Solanum tuberosum TaxID=4113 RepID=M0ZZ03_SOLTU